MINLNDDKYKEVDYNILDKIDNLSLLKEYYPNAVLNKAFNSPLREDKTPSLSFLMNENGVIFFKDHKTGESGNLLQFINRLTLMPIETIIKRINQPILIRDITNQTYQNKAIIKPKELMSIDVKYKLWDKKSINFWKDYQYSIEECEYWNIYPIKFFWINEYLYKADPLSFVMLEPHPETNEIRKKIYQPFNEKNLKWRTNMTHDMLHGYSKLKQSGENLIITKSLKDVGLLTKLGFNAISSTSESNKLTTSKHLFENKFKKILLLYDNDETGINKANEICELHKFTNLTNDFNFYGYKDPSDIVKYTKDINLILNQLKRYL